MKLHAVFNVRNQNIGIAIGTIPENHGMDFIYLFTTSDDYRDNDKLKVIRVWEELSQEDLDVVIENYVGLFVLNNPTE